MTSPIHGLFERMARWRLRRIAARRMREMFPDFFADGGSQMNALVRAPAEHRDIEIVPDGMLPCQVDDWLFGAALQQPEKRLQLAVLQDAVLTFHRWVGHPRASPPLAEVDAWFASQTGNEPFAFVTICDSLNLDPDYIRRGLERWRKHMGATSPRKAPFRRATSGLRHHVVPPRLTSIA